MKKFLLLFAVSIFTAWGAYAQNYNSTPQFSIGIGSGVAIGPVSTVYPAAGELTFKYTYPLSGSQVKLTFTTGYTFYTSGQGYSVGVGYGGFGFETGSDSYSYGSVASFIPVMAGVKIYIADRIFIAGEAGVSFNVNSYSSDYTGKGTAFIYAPSAGYTLPVGYSGRHSLDFSLAYENRPEPGGGYQQIAVHAAYNFGL